MTGTYATTRAQHARYLTNAAITDFEEQLAVIRAARRETGPSPVDASLLTRVCDTTRQRLEDAAQLAQEAPRV